MGHQEPLIEMSTTGFPKKTFDEQDILGHLSSDTGLLLDVFRIYSRSKL